MRPTSLLFATALLSLCATAQETTTDSALTIRTSDEEVVHGAMQAFDANGEAPELGEGAIAILTLDDGGKINVRKGSGDPVFLHVDCRPAQLMEMFAAEIAQYQQMGQMMAGMGGAQMGLDFEDAGQIVSGVFAFPTQIDRLTLKMAENPEESRSLALEIGLDPVDDTWFGGLVSSLKPSPKGVPMLSDDGAMMVVNGNIDMKAAWKSLRPVFGPFARMGQTSKEDKANAARYMDTTMSALEGGFSFIFDPQNQGAIGVANLRDDNGLAALMTEEGYAKMQVAAAQIGDMAEATFDAAAFEHRGVKVNKLVAAYDNPDDNPFVDDDGNLQTFMAVAGNAMVTAMLGSGESEVKGLIDDVLDQNLKNKQLAPQSLVVMKMNIMDLMGMMEDMTQGQISADGDDVPEKLTAELHRTDTGIGIKVNAK